MRCSWKSGLALSLGLLVTGARGEEVAWRAVSPPATAQPAAEVQPVGKVIATSAGPVAVPAQAPPAVSPYPYPTTNPTPGAARTGNSSAVLERPVPIAQAGGAAVPPPPPAPPPRTDQHLQPTSFSTDSDRPRPVFRGQAADPGLARPMPLGPVPTSDPNGPLYGWHRAEDVVAPPPRQVLPMPAPAPLGPVPPSVPPAPGGPLLSSPIPQPGSISSAPLVAGSPQGTTLFASGGCASCAHGGAPLLAPLVPAPGMGPEWEDGSCGPGNRWYVSAEYLLWWIKGDPTPPLVSTGLLQSPTDTNVGALGRPDTRILFGGSELGGTGAYSGGRFLVGYWFGEGHCLGFEVGGFLLEEKTNRFTASSLGSPELSIPFFNANPDPRFLGESTEGVASIRSTGQLAGTLDVTHRTQLWGAEANFRTNLCCGPRYNLDFLLGYRQLGLDETLNLNESLIVVRDRTDPITGQVLVPAGTTILGNDKFSVTNRFYGAQVGLDGECYWRNWSLNLKTKLALGPTQQVVDISGSRILTVPNQAPVVSAGNLFTQPTNLGRHTRDFFTVVPEVGLTLGYQCTDHLRATLGYNLLVWSDVVRAGASVDRTVNSNQLAGLGANPPRPLFQSNSSDFWAQGLTFGLEFRY